MTPKPRNLYAESCLRLDNSAIYCLLNAVYPGERELPILEFVHPTELPVDAPYLKTCLISA